jgi:hypothetical protein
MNQLSRTVSDTCLSGHRFAGVAGKEQLRTQIAEAQVRPESVYNDRKRGRNESHDFVDR